LNESRDAPSRTIDRRRFRIRSRPPPSPCTPPLPPLVGIHFLSPRGCISHSSIRIRIPPSPAPPIHSPGPAPYPPGETRRRKIARRKTERDSCRALARSQGGEARRPRARKWSFLRAVKYGSSVTTLRIACTSAREASLPPAWRYEIWNLIAATGANR